MCVREGGGEGGDLCMSLCERDSECQKERGGGGVCACQPLHSSAFTC